MTLGKLLMLILTLCCLASDAKAQGEQQKIDPTKDGIAEFAIVALGPKPTRKYSKPEDGGEAVMLLAQPGETPPAQLFFRSGKSEDKDGRWNALNIPFNNPSTLRQMPAEGELRLYRKLSGEDNFGPYVTLPAIPDTMRRIFFLMPSKLDSTPWKESPKIRVLTLENSDLKDKNFILANFSSHTVQHAFEQKVESVAPEKIITYRQDEVGQLYKLAARYGKEKKIIYNTAVRLNQEGHIQLFVLYDGSPATNAGREVGVFRMVIPAREVEIVPNR
jgi:hypothetical protein